MGSGSSSMEPMLHRHVSTVDQNEQTALERTCFKFLIITTIVVISRKKATDTGSLLTHFICLALGLLSMKQMERNCIISRVERLLTGYPFNTQFVEFLAVFSAYAR